MSFLGLGLALWQREQLWAPLMTACAVAGLVWPKSRPHLAAAWLCAGLIPAFVPWSNEERVWLVLLVGGLATIVRGIWEAVWYLRHRRRGWAREISVCL